MNVNLTKRTSKRIIEGAPGLAGRGPSMGGIPWSTRRRFFPPQCVRRPEGREARPARVQVWLISAWRPGPARLHSTVQLHGTAVRYSRATKSGGLSRRVRLLIFPVARTSCEQWTSPRENQFITTKGTKDPKETSRLAVATTRD